MEDLTRRGVVDEFNLASRKAEEAVLRRYQAVYWLDYLVGPLGIPSEPSEKQFISCLRNGLILCKIINKVQAGSVSKVIENVSPSQSLLWDSQPLPAYQYFENIRNFLVAVEELKLPVFEASVFEKENLEKGSSSKIVDCILALKAYHEWKQMTGGNGIYKPPRSPLVVHSTSRNQMRNAGRRLDLSEDTEKPIPSIIDVERLEDSIVKALAEHMLESKENIDNNLLANYHSGNEDSVKFFSKILSTCLEEKFQKTTPKMKSSILDHLRERSFSPNVPLEDLPNLKNHECCRSCLEKDNCNHWNLVELQEKELLNIKRLLSSTKKEFESLQSQFQSDMKQLEDQVLEMSNAALGYHKVVKENRNLYNMVQDLKGNIRVYCRIRPTFNPEIPNIIDVIGADGSLVVVDPMKPQKDGKKLFQFNHVFGQTATQDEVFRDTQPLIRSVMDGYNVCIFAYGQTGSGKTHTMSGPPSGSEKELGISYLALNDLFQISAQRKDIIKYEIHAQMVEIYNEQVRDLLAEDSASTRLEIRSCVSDNNLALPGATLREVKSTTDVINLMKLGEINRSVGSTAMNVRSSRSHSILTVHVQGEDVSGSLLRSCLHLVDLAGSERVDKSEVNGDGLKEAQHINKSLACLGDVITALAQKNSHIPYRNSKLTLLLQNSLGGNAKTLMFAHVSPEGCSFGETMSTLKFAQRVSTVELGTARANKESTEVLDLKAQIESLKKTLANKEGQTTPQTKRLKISSRTPLEDKRQMNERKLNIETETTMDRSINYDNRRAAKTPTYETGAKTPSAKTRSRRLSLEGPRNAEKDESSLIFSHQVAPKSPTSSVLSSPVIKLDKISHQVAPKSPTSSVSRNSVVKLDKISHQVTPKSPTSSVLRSSMVKSDKFSHQMVPKSPTRSVLRSSVVKNDKTKVPSLQVAPKSPTSSTLKTPMVKIDTAMKFPSLQVPKTPMPDVRFRNEALGVQTNEFKLSSGILTPRENQGKGSHIRKSLRSTIGKFINGSEKRSQQKQTEATTPLTVKNHVYEAKSTVPSNGRALRRQSLTSIPPEKYRRSSLGGDSCE